MERPGRRPVIGITTYGRQGEERKVFTLPTGYVDALRLAGALPVLLVPGEESAEHILEHLDAVCFAGGGDLDPDLLEDESHPAHYGIDRERDEFELTLMRGALAREVPLLAICRGMQVLNLVLGGDLHVHLPEVVGGEVSHRAPPRLPVEHDVHLDPACRLAEIHGETRLTIASWHHQALDRLGEGLRAVAWAQDGTVEAVEHEAARGVLAVQWHPELQLGEGSPQHRLFAALVGQARSRKVRG